MSRESSMGSKYKLGQFLLQEPWTGDLQQVAMAHEFNRQQAVKKILVHIFLMSKHGLINGTLTTDEVEPPQYIYGTGSTQAAHCAPGQIRIGSQKIFELLEDDDDLSLELENLFAETDNIDLKFNKADSSAEGSGLRAAFGAACQQVALLGRTARFNRAEGFYHHISACFNIYKMAGIQAFRSAITKQQRESLGASATEVATREERIQILRIYLNSLSGSQTTVETVVSTLFDPEEIWKKYSAFARS